MKQKELMIHVQDVRKVYRMGDEEVVALNRINLKIYKGEVCCIGVQAGQMIEHERFGLGEVIKVEGTGDNAKATIHFKNAGDKQLLLRFARFKVVE